MAERAFCLARFGERRRHCAYQSLGVRVVCVCYLFVKIVSGLLRIAFSEIIDYPCDVCTADADVQREEFFLESLSRFSITAAASNLEMSFFSSLYLAVRASTCG